MTPEQFAEALMSAVTDYACQDEGAFAAFLPGLCALTREAAEVGFVFEEWMIDGDQDRLEDLLDSSPEFRQAYDAILDYLDTVD